MHHSLEGEAKITNKIFASARNKQGGGDTKLRYKRIKTPHETVAQSRLPEALEARKKVEEGATLYRTGTTGISHAAEGQFWALEHPSLSNYAQRYGIPAKNVKELDFIEIGQIKPGVPFITRPAPSVGSNSGGAIEVVVPVNGIQMKSFSYIGK